jgi:hypothetical protein
MKVVLLLALLAPATVCSEELIGKVGTRSAYLILHSSERADGSRQVAGEYVILATLARRFVEGERSPQLGVTVLKEGITPILFGRPPIAELRGTWRDGTYKGTRVGPGGQVREEFEFREEFPAMDTYSASVRCEATEGRYQSKLDYSIKAGKLARFEWRSVEPGGQACTVSAAEQQPLRGGLRFASGQCRITLRDLGEFVVVTADDCAAQCAAEAHIEPLLVNRRGNCELLRLGAR